MLMLAPLLIQNLEEIKRSNQRLSLVIQYVYSKDSSERKGMWCLLNAHVSTML